MIGAGLIGALLLAYVAGGPAAFSVALVLGLPASLLIYHLPKRHAQRTASEFDRRVFKVLATLAVLAIVGLLIFGSIHLTQENNKKIDQIDREASGR